jgi:hypothetical protein
MDGLKMTPAAVRAALEGDIENFLVAATPGGIEAQEARGQQDFVNSTTLPIKFNYGNREQFEQMGIVFGEPVDDLFCEAQLPEGWRKEPTDHSMWSDLLDDKGRKRASIFYKAAFYDRSAFLNITGRFHTSVDPVGGWADYDYDEPGMWHCVVRSCGEQVWASDPFGPEPPPDAGRDAHLAWYAQKDEWAELGRSWLDSEYPDYRDPTAYWD